jgi:hypothetical protein
MGHLFGISMLLSSWAAVLNVCEAMIHADYAASEAIPHDDFPWSAIKWKPMQHEDGSPEKREP